MSPAQFTQFLKDWMMLAARYSEAGALTFAFMDWRHLGEILAAGRQVYGELKQLIVWAKTNAGQGSHYRSQHELIFMFKNGGGPPQNKIQLGGHVENGANLWSEAARN